MGRIPSGARARSAKSTGAAVVGIDQAEVPELRALVDVGHAGRGELQRRLDEAVRDAGRRDVRGEGGKASRKGLARGVERAADEVETASS